jgi:hypothetical protein
LWQLVIPSLSISTTPYATILFSIAHFITLPPFDSSIEAWVSFDHSLSYASYTYARIEDFDFATFKRNSIEDGRYDLYDHCSPQKRKRASLRKVVASSSDDESLPAKASKMLLSPGSANSIDTNECFSTVSLLPQSPARNTQSSVPSSSNNTSAVSRSVPPNLAPSNGSAYGHPVPNDP